MKSPTTDSQMQSRVIKGGPLYREFRMESPDEESRTVDLVFSAEETAVERWFGIEVLGHKPGEVDMSRLDSGRAALLMDHNWADQVGVIESAEIGADRKGRAKVRFGKSARADEVFRDVLDGIRQCVSVGYCVNEMVLVKAGKDGVPSEYRVTDWQPFEISIVSVPADMAAGIGRAAGDAEQREITIYEPKTETKEEPKMPEAIEENRQTPAPAATPAVDVDKIKRDARDQEIKRIAGINKLAELHGERVSDIKEMAAKFINEDRSVDDFANAVLAEMAKSSPDKVRVADGNPNIGMSEKEAKAYDIHRVIRSVLLKDPELAPFEREVAKATRDKHKDHQMRGDFQLPSEVMMAIGKRAADKRAAQLTRAITTSGIGAGAELVGTFHDANSFIELLRGRMVTAAAGVRLLGGLVGNLSIPKQTGGATGYWIVEGEAVTLSTLATGAVLLSPKTVAAATKISRMAILQSSPDVLRLTEEDMMQTLARSMDKAVIAGSGASGEPTGIINVSGVGSVTITTAIDWGDIIDLETDVLAANALTGSPAYVTTPALRGTMKQTLKASNVSGFIWEDDRVNGYPAYVADAAATATAISGKCIFGNWADAFVGEWGFLDLKIDEATYVLEGAIQLVAMQTMDAAVRHAESFSIAA